MEKVAEMFNVKNMLQSEISEKLEGFISRYKHNITAHDISIDYEPQTVDGRLVGGGFFKIRITL